MEPRLAARTPVSPIQVTPNLTLDAATATWTSATPSPAILIASDGTQHGATTRWSSSHLTSQDFKFGLRYAFGGRTYYGPAVVKY